MIKMTKMTKNNVTNFIFCIPAIWCFTGLFSYYDANKELAILVISNLFIAFYALGYSKIKQQLFERKFTWVLIAMSIFALLSKVLNGYSSSELRIILSLTVYIIIIPKESLILLKKHFPKLVIIGCLISFIYSIYQTYYLELGRWWSINPIPYTTFSACVAALSLYLSFFQHHWLKKTIYIIASSLAIFSIFISETRGSLLSFIVALGFIAVVILIKKPKFIITLFIPALLISSLGAYFSFDKLDIRFNQTVKEYNSIMNGDLNTSIGYRLQMWQAGYELAKSPTLLGLGDKHIAIKENLYHEGVISQGSIRWTHYHNQFINSFVKTGIIGFIFIIILLVTPIIYWVRHRYNDDTALLGVVISVVYTISSLTDVPLSQSITLGFYIMAIFILTTKLDYNAC